MRLLTTSVVRARNGCGGKCIQGTYVWPDLSRAVLEQDLFRLYDSSVGQRDAWGPQTVKVDARVEDEWDSIYVDCQDSSDVDFQEISLDDLGLGGGDISGFAGIEGGAEAVALGRDTKGIDVSGSAARARAATDAVAEAAASAVLPSQSRRDGGRWRARHRSNSANSSGGGSRSALMAAMDAFQAEEEEDEERRGESQGFDEEDIIDCAIWGRWTFKNDDDPVSRRSPLCFSHVGLTLGL